MTRKLAALVAAAALSFGLMAPATGLVQSVVAAPLSAVDETKVPHYFGPYPNWANSPLTTQDVVVTILGDGAGAEATATVDPATGGLSAITITKPGSGYKTATVEITSSIGSGANATAVVSTTGVVTRVDVTDGGTGYTAPTLEFKGGGGIPTVVGNPLQDRAFATDYNVPAPVVPAAVTLASSTTTFSLTLGGATGGSFTLAIDGGTPTAPIPLPVAAGDIQTALGGPSVVAVTGTDPYALAFVGAVAAVTVDGAGLTQAAAGAGVVPVAADTFDVTIGGATAGTFTLTVDTVTTAPLQFNAAALDVENALGGSTLVSVTGDGSIGTPWHIVFATPPASLTIDGAGLTQSASGAAVTPFTAATYSATVGSATGGTFTLTADTTTTAPLPWNALSSDIQTALVGTSVTGTGTAVDPWVIVFATAPTTVTMDGTALTQPAPPALVPVLVVLPTALPGGTLADVLIWNQATAGGSPTPNAGQSFHAYVLRPVGPDYLVVADSGLLTVPALTTPGVSEQVSFPFNTPVTAGDVLAFYGSGIPVDTGVGTDVLAYPSPTPPAQGAMITVGGSDFPVYPQARTYSFGADMVDTSSVPPADATAIAYGSVNAVTLVDPGTGYTFPTVDFDLPDDPNGVSATGHAVTTPNADGTVTITDVIVDNPGSGYLHAPNVVIRDGTLFDPIIGGTGATATATLAISSVVMTSFGAGYTAAPDVIVHDATGTGAILTAHVDSGAVTSVTVDTAGTGYMSYGIKKFQDTLPGLTEAGVNNLGQYIPLAQPDTTTFPGADYYVIAVVQHRERMSSSLPEAGTLLREYVQLSTTNVPGKQVPLTTAMPDGTEVATMMPDGVTQAVGVDYPHYLGPTIVAQRDRAVRIVFYNLLPKGADGDLFLPTDTTVMGSGPTADAMGVPVDAGTVTDEIRNPMCTEKYYDAAMRDMCFTENRATLHLHGGVTPWISDGTPHQWITPANETTPWPQGVAVQNVPDMAPVAGVPDCTAANDGCQTFYYTNQQSARLMFYHDHAWGITRLNVYAGEAAGYVITDPTEQKLFGPSGTYSDMGEGIPLVIQDRTFVPSLAQLQGQDPTWDSSRWGGMGDLWYHHVYMPAQNPGDPSGMSAYGRWMYGPWFWPPATPQHGPIANPYFGKDPATNFTTDLAVPCSLDDPATWQYQVSPYCEPALIPGTPNISVGMEQFNDTPIVNGTAYPTTTVDPKAYRFRILNAANDRFWNLQWYVADPRDGTQSEVALDPVAVAAAQTDINVVPNPDTTWSPAGPSWIQIGTEGGFLPAPTVVPNQPITWITDPTRFDVGNVDKHSLLLAPAERADTIVDFSKFAGKTLILYNDAPAAFPARVASYDYYLGGPDGLAVPGYGPNTRTIMQVKVAASAPATAFNLTALNNAFKHHADGSGVFEAGQHPIIVGQAAYNSAYGTSFASAGDCTNPNGTNKCDGFARINQQGGDLFRFDTLKGPQLKIPLQPKALHDEMNSAAFDEFGRMTANLGLEAVPATPALQNILLYPYVAPPTEVIDGTNLPQGDINVQAISKADDGTQIWKITHNGVDTHPIHFHLYDVQILNRVTWDNIIIQTEPSELGWKDTIRVSPLEDTIVALRPIVPTLPFEIPNSVRLLNPMMPAGANIDPQGLIVDPSGNVTTVLNALVNFGWEYVYHCHILSHEEMDMMRPVLLAVPPLKADGLSFAVSGNGKNKHLTVTWNDNSITETAYQLQRSTNAGASWTNVGNPIQSPLNVPNTTGTTRSLTDPTTFNVNTAYLYRVLALNTVGYGGAYPAVTAQSISAAVPVILSPTNLTATLQAAAAAPAVQVSLGWTDNTPNETGFAVERSTDGVTFTPLATAPAHAGTGATTFVDTTVAFGTTYTYRVAANTAAGQSGFSTTAQVVIPEQPAAPSNVTVVLGPNGNGNNRSIIVAWADNSTNETGFTVQRATNAGFTSGVGTTNVAANVQTVTVTGLSRNTTYWFRVRAINGTIVASGYVASSPVSILTAP